MPRCHDGGPCLVKLYGRRSDNVTVASFVRRRCNTSRALTTLHPPPPAMSGVSMYDRLQRGRIRCVEKSLCQPIDRRRLNGSSYPARVEGEVAINGVSGSI